MGGLCGSHNLMSIKTILPVDRREVYVVLGDGRMDRLCSLEEYAMLGDGRMGRL